MFQHLSNFHLEYTEQLCAQNTEGESDPNLDDGFLKTLKILKIGMSSVYYRNTCHT